MFVHIEFNTEGGYQILELVSNVYTAWNLGFDWPEINLEYYYV